MNLIRILHMSFVICSTCYCYATPHTITYALTGSEKEAMLSPQQPSTLSEKQQAGWNIVYDHLLCGGLKPLFFKERKDVLAAICRISSPLWKKYQRDNNKDIQLFHYAYKMDKLHTEDNLSYVKKERLIAMQVKVFWEMVAAYLGFCEGKISFFNVKPTHAFKNSRFHIAYRRLKKNRVKPCSDDAFGEMIWAFLEALYHSMLNDKKIETIADLENNFFTHFLQAESENTLYTMSQKAFMQDIALLRLLFQSMKDPELPNDDVAHQSNILTYTFTKQLWELIQFLKSFTPPEKVPSQAFSRSFWLEFSKLKDNFFVWRLAIGPLSSFINAHIFLMHDLYHAMTSSTEPVLDAAFDDLPAIVFTIGATAALDKRQASEALYFFKKALHHQDKDTVLKYTWEARSWQDTYKDIFWKFVGHQGDLNLIKCMCETFSKIDARWKMSSSLLVLEAAAEEGHLNCMQYLVQHIAGLIEATPSSAGAFTPLHVAAGGGHLECVQYLVQQCPRLVTTTSFGLYTVAHIAAAKGRLNCLQYLLEYCPHLLKARTSDGQTLLNVATEDCARYLMQHCPDRLKATMDKE